MKAVVISAFRDLQTGEEVKPSPAEIELTQDALTRLEAAGCVQRVKAKVEKPAREFTQSGRTKRKKTGDDE